MSSISVSFQGKWCALRPDRQKILRSASAGRVDVPFPAFIPPCSG